MSHEHDWRTNPRAAAGAAPIPGPSGAGGGHHTAGGFRPGTGKTQATAYLSEVARALGTTAEYLRYGDAVRETAQTYQADLDKITEIITTGRLEPKEIKAVRQLAETLAL